MKGFYILKHARAAHACTHLNSVVMNAMEQNFFSEQDRSGGIDIEMVGVYLDGVPPCTAHHCLLSICMLPSVL